MPVVLVQRIQQREQGAPGDDRAFLQHFVGHHFGRLVNAVVDGALADAKAFCSLAIAAAPPSRMAVNRADSDQATGFSGKLRDKVGCVGLGGFELIGGPQQFRLDGHQAGPPLTLGLQLVDMLQRGDVLFALDHAIDLLQFGLEIGATELDLLAGSRRARRISIDGHNAESH